MQRTTSNPVQATTVQTSDDSYFEQSIQDAEAKGPIAKYEVGDGDDYSSSRPLTAEEKKAADEALAARIKAFNEKQAKAEAAHKAEMAKTQPYFDALNKRTDDAIMDQGVEMAHPPRDDTKVEDMEQGIHSPDNMPYPLKNGLRYWNPELHETLFGENAKTGQ